MAKHAKYTNWQLFTNLIFKNKIFISTFLSLLAILVVLSFQLSNILQTPPAYVEDTNTAFDSGRIHDASSPYAQTSYFRSPFVVPVTEETQVIEQPKEEEKPKAEYKQMLTKSKGVNYFNGKKETYYSSNVLRHYRISEWHLDSNNFWKTAEENFVVASTDYPIGTKIETSMGTAEVLDCGCDKNVVDFYVCW